MTIVRARLMTQIWLIFADDARNDASPRARPVEISPTRTVISRKRTVATISTRCMESTSTPASSCRISACSATTSSTIGPISLVCFLEHAVVFQRRARPNFPTEHLKIEPWFTNGWQSYGRFNSRPGLGFQILWRPNGWLSILGNQYALGEDALNTPGRVRYHTDDSIEVKYYDNKEKFLDKAAFSLTGDMGCEHGGGVSCAGGSAKGPKQSFLGYMFYNRFWFDNDKYGLTLGGGRSTIPGEYLVLLPPINGATAASGTPYFTENPGDP